MKGLIANVTAWLDKVQAILVSFGVFGVFGIAMLDAALIPIPGGPDAVVMTLSHLNHAMMPLYVLAAVLGSTFGCLVPYWIGRASGEAALRKFSAEKRERATQLLHRYAVWAMLVGAVLPPPFPFKVLLLTAGVFRMSVLRFLGALAIGRSLRFLLEGVMAVRYGDQAAELFKHHYPKIGLGIAGVIIAFLILNALRTRRRNDEVITEGELRVAE